MKLSLEDIERVTPDNAKIETGMPTLGELDHALTLIRKQYPVDVWILRRRLKWLVRKMNKHYNIVWTKPDGWR